MMGRGKSGEGTEQLMIQSILWLLKPPEELGPLSLSMLWPLTAVGGWILRCIESGALCSHSAKCSKSDRMYWWTITLNMMPSQLKLSRQRNQRFFSGQVNHVIRDLRIVHPSPDIHNYARFSVYSWTSEYRLAIRLKTRNISKAVGIKTSAWHLLERNQNMLRLRPHGRSSALTWPSLFLDCSSFTSVTNTHGIFCWTEPSWRIFNPLSEKQEALF